MEGELPSGVFVREEGFENWVPVEVALLPTAKADRAAEPVKKGWVASGSKHRPMLYPAIAIAALGLFLGSEVAWWLAPLLIVVGGVMDYTCHACSGCGEWLPRFKQTCPHCGAKFIKKRASRSPQ